MCADALITRLKEINFELLAGYRHNHDDDPRLWKACGCYHVRYYCNSHWPEEEARLRALSRQNKNPRSAEEGTQYAFTLTMPPDYQPVKPLHEVAKLIMEYGLTNKPYEKACKYAYVLEHTDKGIPHIHGVYQTKSGRRLASKYFKRYWDLWDEKVKLGHGHKGGYHQKVRANESYEGYLEKEGVVIKGGVPPVESDSPDLISHV